MYSEKGSNASPRYADISSLKRNKGSRKVDLIIKSVLVLIILLAGSWFFVKYNSGYFSCYEKKVSTEVVNLDGARIVSTSGSMMETDDFYPVEVIRGYRHPQGLCTLPDGGSAKNTSFDVIVYDNNQRPLASFDESDLGLHSLSVTYVDNKQSAIELYPYNNNEYEFIVLTADNFLVFRVNKSQKSVHQLREVESRYIQEYRNHL